MQPGNEDPCTRTTGPLSFGQSQHAGDDSSEHERQQAGQGREQLLQFALKHAPMMLYQQDRDLRYAWVSNPLPPFRVKGDSVGKTDDELLGPEEALALRTIKQRVLTDGHSERHLVSMSDTSETHFIDLTIEPLRDAQGTITGIIGAAIDVTERKRLEDERERLAHEAWERTRELEALFAAITDGIFVYDANGHLQRTNPAARALMARYLQSDDLALPLQVRATLSNLELRAADGTLLSIEQIPSMRILRGEVLTADHTADIVVRTLTGGSLWLSMSGTPLYDEQGQIVGAVALARDVTRERLEQQRTRQALEAVLQMAHELVQGAESVITSPVQALRPVMNRIGMLTQAVVGCTRLGFAMAEPETQLLRPLAVVGLSTELEAQWWQEQEQQEARLFDGATEEQVRQMQAGELFLVDFTQPPYNELPNPYGIRQMLVAPLVTQARVMGMLTLDYGGADHHYSDEERRLIAAVSRLAALVIERERLGREREQALEREHEMRMAYEQMMQLIELAHDAILVRDVESRIRFWNQGAAQLYGWQQQEALDQVSHTLLTTRFPVAQEHVMTQLAEKGRWEGVLQHQHRAGGSILVESRQVLVRDRAGRPQAILEINRDITEQERTRQEREAARASELAARETTRQMDVFLSMVSHELKTPLTSLTALLQLARRRLTAIIHDLQGVRAARVTEAMPQLQGVEQLLERAERSVGTQNRLIADLVDGSRLQAEQFELRKQPVDLAMLVREVVEGQRLSAPTRWLDLVGATQPLWVQADRGRIEQVLQNYLSNALKYSPPDRPVSVAVRSYDREVRVEVRDEGPGLSAEQQRRVWERFYRVPGVKVRSGSGGGLGLGLAISRMLVELHGGRVGVESSAGNGATFWFTLPSLS